MFCVARTAKLPPALVVVLNTLYELHLTVNPVNWMKNGDETCGDEA